MILLSGPDNAVSFTDDTSPDTHRSKRRNVSIHASVIRGKRLDWYYEILKLFPGFQDELKSTQVLESYKNLPRAKQQTIWNTVKDVHIQVTDALPIEARFDKMVQDAAKNSDGMNLLRQRASQGDEVSKMILNMLNDGMAKLIIGSGLSKSLTHFIRHYEPPGSLRRYMPRQEIYRDDSETELARLKRNRGSVVRNAVVYTSKSGAAFSDAMDVFFEPSTYANPYFM